MANYQIGRSVFGGLPTSKSRIAGRMMVATQRAATDPIFYANLTLQNVTDGSSYRVSMHDSPYTQLANSTQSGTSDIAITNIPCYSNPMLVDITVRNFNGTTNKYKEYNTQANLVSGTTLSYIVQTVDATA